MNIRCFNSAAETMMIDCIWDGEDLHYSMGSFAAVKMVMDINAAKLEMNFITARMAANFAAARMVTNFLHLGWLRTLQQLG